MKKLLFGAFMLGSFVNAHSQSRYDLVIDEIMADPSPMVGLPNVEWIELKNVSALTINLVNFRVGDAGSISGPLPNFFLQPDSVVIICNSSALASMQAFGKTISVSGFPSLDNDNETIYLKSASDKIMHAVSYDNTWYQNDVKKEGGWSLEMIDTKNPCTGMKNWKASNNVLGGTPAKINSLNNNNPDTDDPQLLRAFMTDSVTVNLLFNETIDSASAAVIGNYTSTPSLVFTKAILPPPVFNIVQLKTSTPLTGTTVYTINVNNVKDCSSNNISNENKARVGHPTEPQPGEWIINEILFNPRSNAYDFIEFYNNSDKIIDASKLFIANRNSSGTVSSIKNVSPGPYQVFPHEYLVCTEDVQSLKREYLITNPANILSLPLPSYPDDEGIVISLNSQGQILDEVNYDEDWHFSLLSDPEGVSLERIDPAANSNTKQNWHSAASTAGYGTPGYKNSQYKNVDDLQATIGISPKIFSPDNDGSDDVVTVQYQVDKPGYVANVIIYDISGRAVFQLVNNKTMGIKGYWNWDGLNEERQKLPIGPYIIFTEIFNLEGKKKQFKNVVVLAMK